MPVAPKRLLLTAVGVGIGLALGLLLAGIFEIPKLLTIQTSEDAAHYTGLPVLVSVPELLTPKEAHRSSARRRLLLAARMALTDRRYSGAALVLVEGNAPLRAVCDLRGKFTTRCALRLATFEQPGGLKECTQNFTD